jgi:hypothetical protein
MSMDGEDVLKRLDSTEEVYGCIVDFNIIFVELVNALNGFSLQTVY